MLTRRDFLKIGAAAGASLTVPWGKLRLLSVSNPTRALANCTGPLRKFIQPMRIVGAGIPIAQPDKTNPGWWQPGVTHYTIDVREYQDLLHPDLPGTTTLRGYGQGSDFKHLGGVIAAKRGEPVQITFRNYLPNTYPLPVDDTIMGVMGNQLNRVDVHLHGGFVPWISDGTPHAWWDPDGHVGPSFINNQVLRPGQTVPSNEAEYYYPNQQSARLMWYHDHTFGLTRTNAYIGIATGYVIYDDYELALVSHGLPGPLDPRTIYLVFQDKVFMTCPPKQFDSGWPVQNSKAGDLWYEHSYNPADLGPTGKPPKVSCVPEFFGDTILANGTAYPFLELEQRQYRFRILNACDARFLNPRLVYAQNSDPTLPDPTKPGPGFVQIGTEGGFLQAPVMVNGPKQLQLVMAPAERADLILDLRNVPAGATFILYNDASAPYPMGDDANDFPSVSNTGPDTRSLLQIRVKARSGAADKPISLPGTFTPTDPFLVNPRAGSIPPTPSGAGIRQLSLNEDFDEYGRLIQKLGTLEQTGITADGLPFFGKAYMDPVTENVSQGATEVWEIFNFTGDTHPIHFHLVNVQLLSRQPFDAEGYQPGKPPVYTGKAYAPDANELGWKETIRMNPGEVTRVVMKFKLPSTPFAVPYSPRQGVDGYEYVWHCHILEHEEHDMMRPMAVK